ncbi:oxidoreductase [Rhodococcus opacus]|uniref:oxidoreductase n=1 Tax=Rhodococcus opacus TaxID=37919 RepID=UPI0024B92887|nr:oxidoreductase [Rhodococcus opacus]MDJ0420026.1 oxidoreductase [Rhodococcus opacus]
MPHTFFITGVSTGLGRAFATAALEAGHTVAGTLRKREQIAEFEAVAPGRAHGILLDVTDTESIPAAIKGVEENVGSIDVLVNNAGYGVEGVFEETGLDVLRQQFEVNVFGAAAVTKEVLPYLRERRRGHIVFITSMGGLRAFPGLSAYHGTKYAVEGIADTLRPELAPFGIHVTSIEPGGFRTDWAGRSMTRVERSITDYDELMEPIREGRLAMSGNQLGNPAGAGAALLTIVDAPNPPGHLVLGSDARRLVAAARAEFDTEFELWRDLGESTDFPDGNTLG